MNDTRNPQAAAAEARANYREVTSRLGALGLDTAIPEGVRALAESTVDQTREAYDRSTDAFDASGRDLREILRRRRPGRRRVQPQDHRHRPAELEFRASTSPRAWPAPRTSPTWLSCRRPFGASSSAR